ncbi:unnamed protein product, partial [Mesorhabditis spiculigera]
MEPAFLRKAVNQYCSKEEYEFRCRERLVHCLEKTPPGQDGGKPIRSRFVKEYRRAAAATTLEYGKIRPPNVLAETIDYLLGLYTYTLTPQQLFHASFTQVYHFVCDRLRAVRQDLIVQHATPRDFQLLLEKMIPFYLVTEHRSIVEGCKEYDWKLHSTQLEECFSRWAEIYPSTVPSEEDEARNIIISSYFIRRLENASTIPTHYRLETTKFDPLVSFCETYELGDLQNSRDFFETGADQQVDAFKRTKTLIE